MARLVEHPADQSGGDDPRHHSPLGDRRGRPGRRSARGSPGYGATTDALTTSVPRLSAVEIDAGLAATLRERFAGNPAVVIVRRHATALELPDSRYSGAASFTMLHHVPTAALQDRLFAEVARVLPPGAPSVASDSLPSPEIVAGHEGGTYNPVDPEGLPGRLVAAGFTKVEVKTNQFGWASRAKKA